MKLKYHKFSRGLAIDETEGSPLRLFEDEQEGAGGRVVVPCGGGVTKNADIIRLSVSARTVPGVVWFGG